MQPPLKSVNFLGCFRQKFRLEVGLIIARGVSKARLTSAR